ncbi:fungal trichothecene efflux pump-domain-containing protein [Hypoxylon cercidicola]|nr:fungal trichothecene efflux pump-domain-containing protein [Hypoxylon cercidicola]
MCDLYKKNSDIYGRLYRKLALGNQIAMENSRCSMPAFNPISRRRGKKPVIAAVNGLAVGGGCEFVINCDLVVAAEDASFGLPEVKRRIAAIGGALPRLILNKVVPKEKLLEEALKYAGLVAKNSPDAIICTRAGLRQGWETVSVERAVEWTLEKEEEGASVEGEQAVRCPVRCRKTKRQLPKQLDYAGIFMWTAGFTLLLMGVSWGGSIYPWKSAATISSIVIGVVLLVALFVYEGYAKLEYLAIPVQFFANRGFISLVACATVAAVWPQQVQALYTKMSRMAVGSLATALGQAFGGFFVKRGGNVRYWIIFSTFPMVAFVGACTSLTPETLNAGIAFTMIGPFFVGNTEVCTLALAPLFCRPVDIGLASGLLASIRSAGGSVAVAVYSSILSNSLATTVPANIGPATIDAGFAAEKDPALAAAVIGNKLAAFPGLTDSVMAAVAAVVPTAYAQAFRTVYLASIGFGGIAIVGCLFSNNAQKHLTDKVHRKMHGKVTKKESTDDMLT